jgi:hypothetical protein
MGGLRRKLCVARFAAHLISFEAGCRPLKRPRPIWTFLRRNEFFDRRKKAAHPGGLLLIQITIFSHTGHAWR